MNKLESPAFMWRPKVLFVLRRLDIGGTEKHISRILPELARRGFNVSLYLLERGGRLEPSLDAAGVKIFGPGRASRGIVSRPLSIFGLSRHLRNSRPDIVHFYLTEAYLIGTIAAMLAGVEMRIMSRRSLATYQLKRPMIAWFEKWVHKHTSVLLGNSLAVVGELARECSDRAKVGLIYNGIELPTAVSADIRAVARRELGIPSDSFILTIVANLIAYKGHADLLQALALIRGRLPPGWRLVVVGRDDGEGAALRSQVLQSGLGDHIIWAGEQDSIDVFLNAADVAVLCSHEEGFSNSLIEAMGRGLPTIATSVGGNIDAIVPGESGLLVPARSSEALAAAIVSLSSDPQLAARLGAAARLRVETLFTLEVCVRRYENLYIGVEVANRAGVQSIIDGDCAPRQQ